MEPETAGERGGKGHINTRCQYQKRKKWFVIFVFILNLCIHISSFPTLLMTLMQTSEALFLFTCNPISYNPAEHNIVTFYSAHFFPMVTRWRKRTVGTLHELAYIKHIAISSSWDRWIVQGVEFSEDEQMQVLMSI